MRYLIDKTMKLNQLRDQAFTTAKAHGWHEEEHSDRHFLMLIITELAEAVQADRNGKNRSFRSEFNVEKYFTGRSFTPEQYRERWKFCFEAMIKDYVPDELADACIRIFDLAGLRGIDLSVKTDNPCTIDSKKTFTENIYAIIRDIIIGSDTLEERLRHAIHNIFELSRSMAIDMEWHIGMKMNYNTLCTHKHGGKKY